MRKTGIGTVRGGAREWHIALDSLPPASCIVLLCACLAVHAAEETFALPIAQPHGFRKDGAAFVPLETVADLSAADVVALDAEEADDQLQAKTARDEADGATYLASFKLLRFHCVSDRAGKASLWARIRQDASTRCLNCFGHTWNSETAYKARKLDAEAEHKKNAGKWRWERLRDFAIAQGAQNFDVLWAWPGVPDVDKFVVCRDDKTPDTVKPVSARRPVPACVLESVAFNHSAATKLVEAKVVGTATGATIEATSDGGRTWVAASNVPLTGSFRLRARFAQKPPKETRIERFEARVEMKPDTWLKLENAHTRIDFDAARHGVFRISRPDAAITLASPVEAIPLFSLELKKRGQPWPKPRKVLWCDKDAQASAPAAQKTDGAQTAVLGYAFLDGTLNAAVSVRLLASGESQWELSLDNRSDWDVLTYTFPRLAGLKIGDSGYDDRWANTNLYGHWMAGSQPEDRPYPGWGALGWADLYDGQAGLAFEVRDCLDGRTSFQLRPDPAQWPEACKLEAVKEHCVAAGEKRTWTYVIRPHAGDWHAAADHYGDWFRRQFGAADHFPDWARDSNGWIQVNPHFADATYRWPQLLDTFEEGRRFGLDHLQGWGQFGSNTCGSFWWPSPKWGTDAEFAAANAEIRRRGGHVGYYLMFHLDNRYNHIDDQTYDGYLARDRYPKDVPILSIEQFQQAMSVPDPEGKLTGWPQTPDELQKLRDSLVKLLAEKKTTVWADGAQWTMNTMDKTWQDYLVRWTDDLYVGRWNCDAAYQDVLGCETVGPLFDLRRSEHGHFFGRANMDIARRLFEEGRKRNPAFALIAEGKNELVTRWAMGMTSSAHYGWIYVDTHRYTHPDHILYIGGSNGGWNQPLYNAQLAFLYGAKHDLILSQDAYRIRDVLALRQPFMRYVTRARYRDTVGLRFSGDSIEARRFDRTGDGCKAVLVTIINTRHADKGKVEVDLSVLGPERVGAFCFASDGTARAIELRPQDHWATADVPVADAAAILLVSQPAAGEELLARVRPTLEPDGARAPFWAANLSPQPRQVKLAFAGPGLQDEKTLDLPAFGAAAGELSWPAQKALAGGDVTCSTGGKALAGAYLFSFVDDGSFEKRPPPPDGTPADGKSFLRFGPAKGWQGVGLRIYVEPSRSYRVTVMGRRSGKKGQMYGLVRMKSQARGWQHAALNFPPDVFNQWVKLQVAFSTPSDMTEADLYLYNCDSEETVDYDAVQFELTFNR